MTPFTQFISDNLKSENLVGVEIGVMQGINAIYILEEPRVKKLYLVDHYKRYWSGSGWFSQEEMDACYANAIWATEPYIGRTRFVIKDSDCAAKIFPDNYFDFVYIDAGHSYDEVMLDLKSWWPKTKSGGVFGGHDYRTVNGVEVARAVDDFIKEKGIDKPDPSIGMRVGEAMEWAIIKP